jgi:hypothetical protein
MARFLPPFGLDSLMLIIALIAACSAVMRASLFLGIPLAVLSASALVRTVLQIAGNQTEGRRMTAFDKAITFFVSVAIVLIIGTPAVVSFVVVPGICVKYQVQPFLIPVASIVAAGGAGYGSYRLIGQAMQGGRSDL